MAPVIFKPEKKKKLSFLQDKIVGAIDGVPGNLE